MLTRQRHTWLPIVIFFGFLMLYVSTLVQGVSTADNAEFQWVGATLGLAHPPGFALYTLLSNLMTRLPFSASPAYKINLLSAITSSLTLVFVYLSAHRLSGSKLAGLLSTMALGTATTFWAQATVANVRSLTALFAAAAYFLLITVNSSRFTKNPSPQPSPEGEGARPHSQFTIHNLPFTIFFILIVGFGFSHHLSLAFIFFIMLLWMLWQDWRTWKYVPLGLIGLLPWLYLPWQSAELRSASSFLTYALGLGFGGDFFAFNTPSELWTRAGVMLNVLTFQMHWLLLVAALVGWLLLLWRNRPIAILLGATFAIHTFITATYRAPQTVEYMLPAYVPLVLMMAGIVGRDDRPPTIFRQAQDSTDDGQKRSYSSLFTLYWPLITICCLLFIAVWQGAQHFPSFRFLAFQYDTSDTIDYTNSIFDGAPDDAIVVSNWHWYTALRYRQVVEGKRPDLQVEYVVPQGESYAANWVAGIEDGLAQNRPIIATNAYEFNYAALPPPLPLGEALLWPTAATTQLSPEYKPTNIILGDLIEVIGYKLNPPRRVCFGNRAEITIMWRPLAELPAATLFLHQLGDDGQITVQDDQPANAQANGYSVTQFTLLPGPPTAWGDLLIGAYLADGTPLPDQFGEPRTLLDTLHAIPSGCRYDDIVVEQATFGYGIELIPPTAIERLSTGETITLKPQFVSAKPLMRDLAVSVTMVGLADDGETWAWRVASDGIPATGAIPTLKWIAGSRITDPHTLTVPDEATVGQTVKAWVTVYDAFTNRPIPVLDPAIRQQGIGIPLFETTISEP